MITVYQYEFGYTYPWFVLLAVGLFLWFTVRILHKAGFSGWWALLSLIPVVNVIAVWGFAFARWPRDDGLVEGEALSEWPRTRASRLRELETLHAQGLISEDEYSARRQAILDGL